MNEQTLKLEKGTRVKALLLFYKSMIYFKRMCSGLSIARVVVKNKTSMKDTFFTSVFVIIGFIMAFPLFVLCNLIVDLFLNLKRGRSNICLRGKAVFIPLCEVEFNKFELALDVDKDKAIFYFPKKEGINKKENIVFSSGIFSVSEIFSIYTLVLLTYSLYIRRAIADIPYMYKSLYFYRVYFLILKLDDTNRLYFCNERDEYCALYDLKTEFRKTLVQHGICCRAERSYCNLRYSNVDELYVSDRKYLDCYLNNYFWKKPIVFDFKNHIVLSDLNSDIPTILIISCARLYDDVERKILSFLGNKKYFIYLKPHPTCHGFYYEDFELPNICIIKDLNFFPNSDFVISYESNLAVEYENLGKRVFYHTKYESVESFLNEFCRK